MILLLLADGFEETEALVPLDLLRRGKCDVKTVGITGKTVVGAHGIAVTADLSPKEATGKIDALILPGGMPGTTNLDASREVDRLIEKTQSDGGRLAAICAAPLVLGRRGLLAGKRAVCFPGFDHNRMDKDSGYRWIMIVLDQSIYNVGLDVSDWMDEVNLMDNVSIYFNEHDDPVKIKDIYDPTTTGVAIQLFGQKNIIAISISNEKVDGHYRYGGPEMYKIVVETGTQIPTYENGVAGYREILEKTVLLNDDYQLYGEIPDTMDDYGNPRIYEEWNVNWSVASCYVTFTVLGINGVSYPDMLLEYGERISLKEFAIDGYDLVATTAAGDTIYQCIIGSNRNLDVILTYSVHKDEGGEKKGCGGSIAAGSIAIVMASLATVLFVVRKRKENEA